MKLLLNLFYWFVVQHFNKYFAQSSMIQYHSNTPYKTNQNNFNIKNLNYSRNRFLFYDSILKYNNNIKYRSVENSENQIVHTDGLKLNILNSQFIDELDNNKSILYNQTEFTERLNNDNSSRFWIKLLICVFCTLMIVATLVGNTLVILAVMIVRKLHTEDNANNYLIVSLAISDLLVGIIDMPFALHVEINEGNKWAFTAVLCDLWTLSDVLLCSASILNLVAISIDRYFIIQHAMVYTQRRNAKLMILMIVSVWILSALISIPPLFGWGRASNNLQQLGVCLVSQDLRYQIYATLLSFYIPLLVMIIIYINIYRTAKKIKKKELETCGVFKNSNPHVLISTENGISKSQLECLNQNIRPSHHNEIEQDHFKLSMCSNVSMFTPNGTPINNKIKGYLNSKFQNPKVKHSGSISETSNRSMDSKIYSSSTLSQDGNAIIGSNLNLSNTMINRCKQPSLKTRLSRRLTSVFSGIKRNSHLSASQGKNQKATQTLGIIMGCFILCWLPFFILAVVKPIPLHNGKTVRDFIPIWLDSLLLWLGYFNSALNPIIYARFNREFRRPFIEILCFRCFGINEKLRDEERKKIYMDANFLNSCAPINHSIARTSASSGTTVGFGNIFSRNFSRKNHLDINSNDSNELISKIVDKSEHRNNINIIINNASDDNLTKIEQSIDEKVENSENINEDDKIHKNDGHKHHKLNELVSSRYYNLTIMNDNPMPSNDLLIINMKIDKSNDNITKKKENGLVAMYHDSSKKTTDFTNFESEEITPIEPINKKNEDMFDINPVEKSSKLLLKQNIKLKQIKQPFTNNDCNKNSKTNNLLSEQEQIHS